MFACLTGCLSTDTGGGSEREHEKEQPEESQTTRVVLIFPLNATLHLDAAAFQRETCMFFCTTLILTVLVFLQTKLSAHQKNMQKSQPFILDTLPESIIVNVPMSGRHEGQLCSLNSPYRSLLSPACSYFYSPKGNKSLSLHL